MRFLLFFLLLAAPALARPDCAGPVTATARIARVEKNGALALADGRMALLAGIRLPQGAQDHAPANFARVALAALDAMAARGPLTLTATPPLTDRYDRIRVQAFDANGDWIQTMLLRRGLARVQIAPDRTECAAEFYAAEAEARNHRAGLWSSPVYAVRDATAMHAATGTFQIVEGRVLSVTLHDGRAWLDFGTDYKKDFAATIAPDDRKIFRTLGVDPRGYEGKRVRLRGIVQTHNGSVIELANPAQIENLP
jgi:micrococcal nuclease